MAATPAAGDGAGHHPGYSTPGYRGYVLFALLLVYTFNFIDRSLLAYVQEQIKVEFELSDFQIGILGGATFAVLYTAMGIPIARLAERKSRVNIITISLTFWSLMTAACGMAVNYATLLLARVGVGIGEAGGTPPSQSMISDYFPSNKRATAIAIYSMGVTLGTMIAGFGGGWIAQNWDWRVAFIAIGLPGVLVAVLFRLTVKEPPRSTQDEAPNFWPAFREISRKPTFWWASLGGAAAAFVGYGVGQYYTSFFIRTHEMSIVDAGRLTATLTGVGGSIGVLFAGWLSDRIAHRHPNALAWLPVVGFLITTPLAIMTFRSESLGMAVTFAAFALTTQYFYLGSQYSITQGVVHPKVRATATAVLLFIVNFLGYVFGPPVIGAISDHFAGRALAGTGRTLEACLGAPTDPVCAGAIESGLRTAAQLGVLVFLLGAICFAMAWRTMQKDWWRGEPSSV